MWCFSNLCLDGPGCGSVSRAAQASAGSSMVIFFSLLFPSFGHVSPGLTPLVAANESSLKDTVHCVAELLVKTSGGPSPVGAVVQRSDT